jgi:hypothetical protein
VSAPTRSNIRAIASWILFSFQGLFAVLHVFPPLAYRVGAKVSTASVVAYINELGPVWISAFGITALGLGLSLILRKGHQTYLWHLMSGAVFGGYTAALFVGAFGDSPHGPVTYPVLAALPVIGHFLLALSYSTTGGDR